MRWFWIDRFTSFTSGRSATAVKSLSSAEDYFAEHFPGFPVMPGSLLLEGLAQTGGILVGEAKQFREKVVLAKIPKANFYREVSPGDMLTYQATILELRDEGALVSGLITVGDEKVVEAEIFFAHLDQNRSGQLFGDDNFVFDSGLKTLVGAGTLVSLPPGP